MSEMKLSGTINVTLSEAKALIDQYFKVFPTIGNTLKFLGQFGVKNGYIQTIAPFFRKRWFPFWKFAKSRIGSHLAGQYDATLGEIERASKNQPKLNMGWVINRVNCWKLHSEMDNQQPSYSGMGRRFND